MHSDHIQQGAWSNTRLAEGNGTDVKLTLRCPQRELDRNTHSEIQQLTMRDVPQHTGYSAFDVSKAHHVQGEGRHRGMD
jgi:hypothetical protein